MERLQAGRVGKVRRVRVRGQRDVGVGRVAEGEVGDEVVEAAVVRFADEGDFLEDGFCGVGRGEGRVVDEGEAVGALGGQYWACCTGVV